MLRNYPLVSVIIPNFNRVDLISQAINSVINQTYLNWELIIVDDGSNDGALEVVQKYSEQNERIKFFTRDRSPKGAPTCRNIGLAQCTGEFVMFLDSDDLLAPFCLTQRMELFTKNMERDFLVFPILLFNKDVDDLNILWNIDTEEDDLLRFLRIDALWQTTGPIYKREALMRIGGFREDLSFWQDFDLHLRCLLLGFSYLKFMDVTPDIYHRRNLVDGISRTIPLASDKKILQKRIDFYFDLLEFVDKRNIFLKAQYKHTIWSMLFYFVSFYLTRHKSIHLFLSNLSRVKRKLQIGWLEHILSLCYTSLIALSSRIRFMSRVNKAFSGMFKSYLPDYQVISNTTLARKPHVVKQL